MVVCLWNLVIPLFGCADLLKKRDLDLVIDPHIGKIRLVGGPLPEELGAGGLAGVPILSSSSFVGLISRL